MKKIIEHLLIHPEIVAKSNWIIQNLKHSQVGDILSECVTTDWLGAQQNDVCDLVFFSFITTIIASTCVSLSVPFEMCQQLDPVKFRPGPLCTVYRTGQTAKTRPCKTRPGPGAL